VDKETGALYGHIIAGRPGGSFAYFVSATDIKADIQQQLHASVDLPDADFDLSPWLLKKGK
jgi:hypothetical protein